MQDKDGIIIIGASGHGKVVASTLLASNNKISGFVDDDSSLLGSYFLGCPVLGNLSFLSNRHDQAAIIAIGDNKIRKKIAEKYAHLRWQTAIHPKAYVHPSVTLGEGTVVFAGAIIQPDAVIGRHAIVNTSTSIDHDCRIDDYAHIAPGSHLAGNITIAEGALVGIGSSIIPGMTIGQWTLVGAGSVVVNNINHYAQVKGVPAKVREKFVLATQE